jgi:hypothetical protein
VGVPRRTPEELEPSWLAAYELRLEAKSLAQIAAILAGPPHHCGSRSTARDWIEAGRELVAAKGDPTRSRRARREMALDALDRLRVKMDQDLEAGLLDAKREAYYKLQRQYILDGITIAGAQAPRELPKVKRADGSKTAATPGELFDSLAAIPVDEILDALSTLPDGKSQR